MFINFINYIGVLFILFPCFSKKFPVRYNPLIFNHLYFYYL